MIKVYALLPKRPDISEERFHEHWSTIHREHALRITRLRRYVQAHRTAPGVAGLAPAPYHGIPEVWYDSLESAVGQNEDPDYTEYAQKDEPNFVDMTAIRFVMTDQRLLGARAPLEQETPAAKLIVLARRPEGVDVAGFQERWWSVAGALLGLAPDAMRAAAAVTRPETYGGDQVPEYDAVAELWWPDEATLRRSWGADGPAVLDALGRVADLSRSHGLHCEELRVIWPGDDAQALIDAKRAAA